MREKLIAAALSAGIAWGVTQAKISRLEADVAEARGALVKVEVLGSKLDATNEKLSLVEQHLRDLITLSQQRSRR